MARFRKNEPTATKRRVRVFIYEDDGVTPAPSASTFPAVSASLALSGTHHATLTSNSNGAHVNGWTMSLAADGAGAGSMTNVGGTNFTFHYATGVTTMANFATAAVSLFTFSGHTPADILTSPGDTQGPLTFAGGIDYGWETASTDASFTEGIGIVTNCTRNLGTAIDGAFQYEFDQSELNFVGAEVSLKLEYPGFATMIAAYEMNDAADFDSIGEGSNTYGDMERLMVAILWGLVADFRTGILAFKSMDGTKTRGTGTTGDSGRVAGTLGDLTP